MKFRRKHLQILRVILFTKIKHLKRIISIKLLKQVRDLKTQKLNLLKPSKMFKMLNKF